MDFWLVFALVISALVVGVYCAASIKQWLRARRDAARAKAKEEIAKYL